MSTSNGTATKEEAPRLTPGRPFVRAGQRFASVFVAFVQSSMSAQR
jgi:hypothetical protein